jgi:peptidoglycan/LPS O-acetylase OafA/YrhL
VNNHKEVLPLTGLRFVAALYVFLFHIQLRWPVTDIKFINNIIGEGAVGMSVFFMLSGYLLMMNYSDFKGGFRDYFVNRLARIYPVYFIAGLITLPWLGISFDGTSKEVVLGFAKMLFVFFANILVIQAWFPQLFNLWNNGGSWSISVEMFCYALLPLMIPYLNRMSKRGLLYLILGCYIFSVMSGLSVKLLQGPGVPVFYAMPIFRLPEFIIGACTFLLIKQCGVSGNIRAIQAAALSVLLIYLGLAGGWMPIYIGHNWIVLPVVALTICVLSVGGGVLSAILSHPLAVWLGKISYCFYSFQALLILSLITYHDRLVELLPIMASGKILAACAFMCLIVLSAAGYYLVEEPSRRFIRNRWSSEGKVTHGFAIR